MARGALQWWRGKAMGLHSLARIAPHLREPLRFCARQVARRQGVGRYRLRDSGVTICIRHSTGDVITMEEVLADRHYDPPAQVQPVLQMNGRPLEVADLGANVGLFTAWLMGRRRDARVVAFEPDPANAAVLREFLRANGRQDDVEVVQACAATEEGQVSFAGGGFGGSHVLAAGEQADAVMSVPATDAFPYITRADLLKIDIEGGEWAILADSRFANVAAQALVLEYHAHLCPEPDPRACADRLLADAGWTVQHVDVELPPGHGLLWAWK